MKREELQRVREALALLNSMVNCGEQHSTTSKKITQAAFEILSRPLPPAEGAKTCWGCGAEIHYLSNGLPPYRCDCGAVNPAETMERQPQPTAEGAEETAQRCPVCGGNGLVANGFYNQTSGYWLTSSISPETCRTCNGTGVILPSYLHAQKIADKMVSERLRGVTERCKKLEFMIDKGLGWDDMKNDITMPHEL